MRSTWTTATVAAAAGEGVRKGGHIQLPRMVLHRSKYSKSANAAKQKREKGNLKLPHSRFCPHNLPHLGINPLRYWRLLSHPVPWPSAQTRRHGTRATRIRLRASRIAEFFLLSGIGWNCGRTMRKKNENRSVHVL